MTTVNTPTHDVTSAISLVRELRQIAGLETSAAIAAEIKIYRDLQRAKEQRQTDLQVAAQKLYDVPADVFDAARNELIDVSLRSLAERETDDLCIEAASHRLRSKVYDEARGWQAVVTQRFNDCVADHQLNELGQHLPNFSDPGSFNVTSLSQASGQAIEQWRNACVHLHPLWDLYRRLVAVRGDTIIGPAGVDDTATNILTSVILGEPHSWGQVQTAASWLVKVAQRDDSARAFGSFLPFAVPVLAGYRLHLHTTDEATAMRNRLQNGI